jgi:hypothetical protein
MIIKARLAGVARIEIRRRFPDLSSNRATVTLLAVARRNYRVAP